MAKKKRRQSVTNKIMEKVISVQNEKTPHDLSRKNYIRNTKRFIKFCREKYDCRDFDSCKEHIQDYCDYLQENNYSPSTIHTYIASICSTYDLPMSEIDKPIRHIGEFTRGRKNIVNHTNQDLNDITYKRLVDFQMAAGLRRAELKSLRGNSLTYDESGYPCLRVIGKGRKLQYQRLSDEDFQIVKPYFEGKAPDEPIFTEKELDNDLNLHLLRARSAQKYYEAQLERILNEPGYEEQLREEIIRRWNKYNIDKRTGKPKYLNPKNLEGWYIARGSTRQRALQNGRPIKVNRLALLSTSVFRLSHYRLNVAYENYIIV